MRNILIALMLVIAPATQGMAEQIHPREIAGNVATQIRDNFYDPKRGLEIAKVLNKKAAEGGFDNLEDPLILAEALTGIISQYDGHFRVMWAAPEPKAGNQEVRGQRLYGFGDLVHRSGYGFRKIAVLPANIGYFDMTLFANIDFADRSDSAKIHADAVLALMQSTDAVIIDLRDNGGGSPAMVGYLTSAFTKAGAPIYNIFHARDGKSSEAPDKYYSKPILDKPLYILTSAQTSSAGEALPYTLQAAGRAIIVGENSAGAANPGRTFEAGDGFEVFVSTGTPINSITGSNWESSGVVPDHPAKSEDALIQAQILALTALAKTVDSAYRNDIAWSREALEKRDVPIDPSMLAELAGSYGRFSTSFTNNILTVKRGRRPATKLLPLGKDLFFHADDPLKRIRFVRDESGQVIAMEWQSASGSIARSARD